MGGPGIIISKSTLEKFVPHIRKCLLDLRSLHEDVEIGRCIKKYANISCTWNYEMLHILYNHPNGTDGFRGQLSTARVARAINLHPIKDVKLFDRIHYTMLFEKIRSLELKKVSKKDDPMRQCQCTHCQWTYITPGSQYSTENEQPVRSLHSSHKKAIQYILDHYTAEINENARQLGRYVDNMAIQNGYTTFSEDFGFMYLLNIIYQHHKYKGKKATRTISKRICAVLPLFDQWYIVNTSVSDEAIVNFIVPCYGRSKTLIRFLTSFNAAFGNSNQVSLTMVISLKQKDILAILSEYKAQVKTRTFNIVYASDHFDRAKYRAAGAGHFSNDSLLFFIDLDIVISKDLLIRIKQSVVKNTQVYMPIVFSQNEHRFWQYKNSECSKNDMCLNEDKGFWRQYGFGMIGIYKEDLIKVGGWDISISGWGKEDVNLVESLIKNNYTVFRPNDPSLVHLFHSKQCKKKELPIDQYKMCLGTQSLTAASYASTSELVLSILSKLNQSIY